VSQPAATSTPSKAVRPASRLLTVVAVVLLAVLGLIALAGPLSRLLLPLEQPNEGWNAVHAMRWIAGGPLYPPRGSWIVNNYPPLWFMLEGALGAWLGDPILAGRIVALAAFAAAALLIAAAVRALGGDRLASAAAAIFFVAVTSCAYDAWIGLAEPQMLAHALMLAGLVILLRAQSRRAAALAALPMVAALFVKHNVVAIPLASLLWLVRFRRPLLTAWLSSALVAGLVAAAAVLAAFGGDFVAGLAYPRVVTLSRLATNLGHASKVAVVLVAWAVLLWTTRGSRDAAVGLVGGAIVAALLEIAATGGALGVSSNVAFDLVIAGSLALGVLLARIAAQLEMRGPGARRRADVVAALLLLAVTIRAAISLPQLPTPFHAQARVEQAAALEALDATRARLAAISGPVACETLSLCVWAGHVSDIDLWKLRHETTLAPSVDAGAVVARIGRGDYAAVVLLGRVADAGDDGNLPGLTAALDRAYPHRAISDRISLFWR
jgi:hypothetical protein